MTAFLANVIRNEDKHPEPYTYKDFLVDWNELWDTVAAPSAPELTEEEEQARNEAILNKVMAANIWFGGTVK